MVRAEEIISQRPFTVAEYHRLAEVGILRPDERVELIRGVIRQKHPRSRAHVITTTKLLQRMVLSLERRSAVFKGAPLTLTRLDSEPEPDIVATSSPAIEDYGKSRALLVVEVAETSLRYDLNAKAPLYAEAGVPEYWVVNLVDRELVVFRTPEAGTYRDRTEHGINERVAPEAWPDVVIEVDDLFPTAEDA